MVLLALAFDFVQVLSKPQSFHLLVCKTTFSIVLLGLEFNAELARLLHSVCLCVYPYIRLLYTSVLDQKEE